MWSRCELMKMFNTRCLSLRGKRWWIVCWWTCHKLCRELSKNHRQETIRSDMETHQCRQQPTASRARTLALKNIYFFHLSELLELFIRCDDILTIFVIFLFSPLRSSSCSLLCVLTHYFHHHHFSKQSTSSHLHPVLCSLHSVEVFCFVF